MSATEAEQTLYAPYAELLAHFQPFRYDLPTLLDPTSGLAPRLRHLCTDALSEDDVEEGGEERDREREALRLEADTWGLLQVLMPQRLFTPDEAPSLRSLLAQNPYIPPADLVGALQRASRFLAELIVVRDWASEVCAVPHGAGTETGGYWRFTRVSKAGLGAREGGLVQSLDPDGPTREGKALAVDDAAAEHRLLHALFGCVRAGRLDAAVSLCQRAHQPWRAAALRGAVLARWGALSPREGEESEDEEDDRWRGNVRRGLWKTVCTRSALDTTLPPLERALNAALAPSPQTVSALRLACRTWADELWVRVCVACEERLDRGAREAGARGWYWADGWEGTDEIDTEAEDLEMDTEGGEEEWEREVIDALESLAGVSVAEGPPASHPFHITQLHIVLNRLPELLDAFATGLMSGSYDPRSPEYPVLTRFFAHLGLYLRLLGEDVPAEAMRTILEAYLQVLEAAGQRELIALYAGALGENAVERYATFLASLALSADAGERKHALSRAQEHGLDVERVAIATAEKTMEHAFQELPPPTGPLPSIIGIQPPPSKDELLLIRSIEWTVFYEATYSTALEQANVILRYFLARGRVRVAQSVLDMLPSALGRLREPEDRATEYMHYRQFFNVWDILERVVECTALEVPHMSKEARAEWLEEYKTLLEQAHEQVVKLLTTEWLVSDVEESGGDRRRLELIRTRQIYIPELVIRLHSLLVASRSKIPENLKHALQLANVVADSRYKLYEDFINQDGRRLGDYLGAVRQAILAGLEGGGSDPFRIVTQ
ncbi:nuclear pore protein 84/107 [Obba rivulosa]|uniref:Nuclear pore complex protein n=1 Tax=Obba rivulosa TaxID=1052685 RepID=A0A8E2DNP6_9APHY|nr:nuclear pore protein 84/107 [Obba rivulosa]